MGTPALQAGSTVWAIRALRGYQRRPQGGSLPRGSPMPLPKGLQQHPLQEQLIGRRKLGPGTDKTTGSSPPPFEKRKLCTYHVSGGEPSAGAARD